MSPTSVPPEAEWNAGESWWVKVPSFQKTILLSSHRSIIACHISIISTFQDISWYYILIPVNKSKAVRLGTRLFSNDALPQWSLLYKCCLPVVGLLKSRHWKTLKRGCTTVLWQDMQSNAVREHPVRLCCEHRQCQGHKNSSNETAWHDKPYKLWHSPCGR